MAQLTYFRSESPAAAFVIAHGAGAGQKSAWMQQFAAGMQARGITAATFDFPYVTAGRSVPDKAPVLEESWREAIADARRTLPGLPLFIGGKSMGGRMASHVAAQGHPDLAGLVLLGYPLHPPGKPMQRRDAHLPQIAVPTLFVQGSRDTFGTTEEIRGVLPGIRKATLHEVVGGDHSFKVPGGAKTQRMDEVMDVVAAWIKEAAVLY